uniref:alcohol dehydrogenase n=1 Tax=Salix viminalis TaxID=40686 RepID=A0A6N2N6D4_SALVM
MALSVVSVSINTASPGALKLRRETTLPSWLNRSISSEHNKQGLNVVRVVRASCLFNPTNEPILKDALKEPVAFMGGMFAGLLRLDLKEDPLKEWVTRTVEASGITEEDIDAEGLQQEEQREPQHLIDCTISLAIPSRFSYLPPYPFEKAIKMSSSIKQPNVITCKAAVAWGAGEALVMQEVEVSPPHPQEIRIKVVTTSLCRSDLSALDSHAIFPRIFGHEASGIVESIGEGVAEFQEGDHVLTVFTGECKTCRQCMSGKSNMCQVLGLERRGVMHSDQGTRFSIKGKPVYHYCAVSSFSEYTVVHTGCAVKVSSAAPLEKICLLSCGLAAGLGAAWNVADISKGSTVVIFGLGTVGLSVAQGAKIRGASQIIGVDTNPEKRDKAKDFGITEFINPNDCNEPIQQVIKRITDGGADYSFECIGDTGMITTALQSCCDGWGLTVTLGVPKVKPEVSAHYGLFLSGRTLKGSLFGGWKPKSDLPSLVDMYMNKEIKIDEFITHNLPFEEINKAFELMREGKCLRCQQPPLSLRTIPAVMPARKSSQTTGSFCCKCICWTVGLLVLLLGIVGATAGILYLVFKPEIPNYSVDSLTISDLRLNFDMTLYAKFDVKITANNPNKKIGIYYEKGGRLSVWYTKTKLCHSMEAL